jgi:tripartite-type tricarboxylate transporter receptor subunit TctC
MGRRSVWLAIGAGLLWFGIPGAGQAQTQTDVADFYRGKTVRVLVGFGPGGSSTFYGDILARYMGRHLPGNPNFIVQHMPGAGGVVLANYIAQKAPRDGTEFAITARTVAFEPQLGNKNAAFDPLTFNWIGNANVESSTCISWHTANVKTMADLLTSELIVGGTGSETLAITFPKALNKLAGTKFRIVTGYPSSVDIMLGMERGELQGFCSIGWTFLKLRKPDWLAQKKINLLFQLALEKHPEIPDVPLALDLAKTPEDRQVLELLLTPQEMGRPFFAPPQVPAARVAALRDAFAKTLADPDFLRDAEKAGVEVQYTSGEAVQALLTRAYAAPPDVVRRANEMLR